MLFANVNGQKVEAMPKLMGTCPMCGKPVLPKCGEINIWHWAHQKDDSCDNWYEPETQWHKNWKLVFGKEHCEIVILRDNVRHIADILTEANTIIELQNSNIEKATIRQREVFYGARMIWVINGKPFNNNFSYKRSRSVKLDEDDEYYYRYNPSAIKNSMPLQKDEYTFSWRWYRSSWSGIQREVFIDLGDENLFWVTKGMGTKTGTGKLISKATFVKEHVGNVELLETLIDKTTKPI